MNTYNFVYSKNKLISTIKEHKLKYEKEILIQIFSSNNSKKYLKKVRDETLEFLPNANIVGSTSDGEILENYVNEFDAVISITVFKKTSVKLDFVDNNSEYSSYELGQMLAFKLITNETKVLLLFTDGLYTNGEEFLNGILSVSKDIIVSGGMAGDAAKFEHTYIFDNTNISENGAVGVSLNSHDLIVNTASNFNWSGIGKEMIITSSDQNRVYEIDGKKALEIYEHYLGSDVADALPGIGIEFPLIIQNDDGSEVARAVLNKNDDKSLNFAGNINEGQRVKFGYGNINSILQSISSLVSEVEKYPIESIFIYSCMARKRFLEEDIDKELQPFSSIAPTMGFFTYGEFYKNNLLNQTMTLLLLSESKKIKKIKKSNTCLKTPIKVHSAQKALSHLVNISSKELEDFNEKLEKKVDEKTSELENKIVELEKATSVKSDFLASMSHEIRTPLNAILGFIDILKNEENDVDKSRKFGIIKSSGDSLLNIINDILDFSKMESGKFEIENSFFETKKVFSESYGLFLEKAIEKDIVLSFEYDENLPNNAYADFSRLKQILNNLLSNAIKFTQKYGHITLDITNIGENVIIHVKDNGVGIAKASQGKIFDAFEQVENRSELEGTGLGLSISKRLANLMGGDIFVESTVTKGSTFTVVLPIFQDVSSDITVHKEVSSIEKQYDLSDKTVLIAEDDPASMMLLEEYLKEFNFHVDKALNGLEALESMKLKRYDFVFMDENMPVMSGSDATIKIREYEINMGFDPSKIIAVTANALQHDEKRFLKCGMDDYISKPVDRDILKTKIIKHLV